MNDANPRQQIVDSIKNNNNILVTVSTNPSVDELSAALGLTVLLNNLGKRGTAVVSGQIPPAITFLEPDKTFESTTDSLRDFIIALDKEKADHLRYKVDGDVVKIFITPYRTQLSEGDLEFSLGDYNVEVVVALGVQDQDHLDKALDAQGAILHDATIVTLTAGEAVSNLGSINWQDQTASSLCEMLVSLSEALKEDKPLLDQQTSTAFLTGIVSSTDRFSNDKTSSRVMTMAAQLMAAGANQQLIAAKLEEAHEIGPNAQPAASQNSDGTSPLNADGTMSLAEGAEPEKVPKGTKKAKKAAKPEDGLVIEIDHPETEEKPAEAPAAPQIAPAVADVAVDGAVPAAPAETAEEALARELAEVVPPKQEPTAQALNQELTDAAQDEGTPPSMPLPDSGSSDAVPQLPTIDFEALLPKTSTPDPAPAPAPAAPPAAVDPSSLPPLPPLDSAQPTQDVAAHPGYMTDQPGSTTPMSGATQSDPSASTVDPFATPLVSPSTLPPLQPDPLFAEAHQSLTAPVAATITPPHTSDQIDYEESPIRNDPAAVAAVPDFAAMNPTGLTSTPQPAPTPAPAAAPSLDNLPPLPPLPPLPDVPNVPPPPLPDLSLPEAPAPAAGTPPAPGEFKIPGQ